MDLFSVWRFGVQSIVFLSAIIVVFFVPGFSILERFRKLTSLERMVGSIAIGIGFFGLQGYLLGYAHLRQLSIVYVLVCGAIGFLSRKKLSTFFHTMARNIHATDRWTFFLLLSGMSVQVLQMAGSGLFLSDGMRFFRVHAQDGIFHLSLISSLVRQFPPVEPGGALLPVVNYHYWSDLVLAELVRLFHFPVHTLFFQLIPPFLSLLTGFALVALTRKLTQDKSLEKTREKFALFFLFFGGDAAYLFMLKLHGVWGFFTSAIDNGATQFLNMPHVFAKFLFLVALVFLLQWRKERDFRMGLVTGFLAAVLFGMKIYFALLFVVILVCFGVEILWKSFQKRHIDALFFQYIGIGGLSLLLALAIYLPPNRDSGGLGWYPLEWVKLMLSRENLDWTDLSVRRALALYYHNPVKGVLYDIVAIIATLLSIHGTRLLGFLVFPRAPRYTDRFLWESSLIASLLFTILGLYTLQHSGSFNVFNFFAASLTLLSLFTALLVAELWQSKKVFFRVFVLTVCVLTIPRIVYETHKIISSYRDDSDVTIVSRGEIEALNSANEQLPANTILQSHPDNALDAHTPYVAYFSNRVSYIAGSSVLETHNQPTSDRLGMLRALFQIRDPKRFHEVLLQSQIGALYLTKGQTLPVDARMAGLTIVFTNSDATVYRAQ